MPAKFIPIEKDLIPYRFEVELGAELYEMEIRHNEKYDFFTLDLFKEGETLVLGEKVVYGVPLFDDVFDTRFPAPTIVPLDESGLESDVTFDNFNVTVFLLIDNEEEEL